MFSISVFGDTGVGKTSFCRYFVNKDYQCNSITYDHTEGRTIYPVILGYPICRHHERIRVFLVENEKDIKGDAAFFLFNSHSSYSLHEAMVEDWLYLNDGPAIAVLTKGDLVEEQQWFSNLLFNDSPICQVSAKSGYNMDKPIRYIIDGLRKQRYGIYPF